MKPLLWLIPAFALLLMGCEKSAETDHLRLANAKQPSNALTFIALEQGYFEQEGLKVEVESFPSGRRALLDGYLQGNFDLFITTEVPYSFQAIETPNLKVFGHIFSANNVNRIISRKDAGIDKLSDLKGHKIATQKNSAVHFFLTQVLKSEQIGTEDVNLSYLKAEDLPRALSRGEIDAFSMREPYITQATKLLKGQVNVFASPGLYNQYEVLVADIQTLQTKHRAFEKLIKGLLKAQDFAYHHPDQAAEILAKALNIEIETVFKSWRPHAQQVGLQQGLLVTLEDQQRWILQLPSDKQTQNIMNMIYFPIMEQVAPELISIVKAESSQ